MIETMPALVVFGLDPEGQAARRAFCRTRCRARRQGSGPAGLSGRAHQRR